MILPFILSNSKSHLFKYPDYLFSILFFLCDATMLACIFHSFVQLHCGQGQRGFRIDKDYWGTCSCEETMLTTAPDSEYSFHSAPAERWKISVLVPDSGNAGDILPSSCPGSGWDTQGHSQHTKLLLCCFDCVFR